MWKPQLTLLENTLETARDSYVLSGIQGGLSVRRPFLAAGLFLGAALGAFVLSFRDVLYGNELVALIVFALLAVIAGLNLAQLHIISRDLRGTTMSEAVWGPYAYLNRKRRDIAKAIQSAQAGGLS